MYNLELKKLTIISLLLFSYIFNYGQSFQKEIEKLNDLGNQIITSDNDIDKREANTKYVTELKVDHSSFSNV